MVPVAEPGWYPLPSDPSKVIYYDGVQWVGSPVPAPSRPAPVDGEDEPSTLDTVIERAKSIASNEEHQGTAMAVAGGAAIADGIVGIGKRPGLGKPISAILFGIVFIALSSFILNIFAESAASPAPPMRSDEVASTLTISSLGYDTDGFCVPYVVVEDVEVPVRTPMRTSPCAVSMGDSIEVFHVPGVPQTTRFSPDSLPGTSGLAGFIGVFRLMFIGAGAFMILGGVLSLLGKLGVIAGGGVLMWLGLKRRREAREEKAAQ